MTESQTKQNSTTGGFGLPRQLLFAYSLIITLSMIGVFVPGYPAWGFNLWSLFPEPMAIILLVILALTLIPRVSEAIQQKIGGNFHDAGLSGETQNTTWLAIIASLTLFLIFFLLRSEAHIYGNGFQIIRQLEDGQLGILQLAGLTTWLSVVAHFVVIQLLSLVADVSVANAFAVVDCVAGVAALWAIYRLSGLLAENILARLFIIICCLTGSATVLFFGYVEFYAVPTMAALWTLYYSLYHVRTGHAEKAPLVWGVVATLSYWPAVSFLIVAVISILYRGDKKRRLPYGLTFRSITIIALSGTSLVALLAQLAELSPWLLSIWPMQGVSYAFLTPERWLDIFNLIIMVSPLGAILLITRFIERSRRGTNDIELNLLGLAALLSFVSTFWIEPSLGMPRDWAAFSLFGFPLTLWGVGWLYRYRLNKTINPVWLVPAIAILLVQIAPNIYEKNDLSRATEHLDGTLWGEPHHQSSHRDAEAALGWGLTLDAEVTESALAERSLLRRLQTKISSPAAWHTLGLIYSRTNLPDSAFYCAGNAVAFDPENPSYLTRLAEMEMQRGMFLQAIQHVVHSSSIRPNDFDTEFLFGVILTRMKNFPDALDRFERAALLKPREAIVSLNIGLVFVKLQQSDSAYVYLNEALKSGLRSALLLEPLIRVSIAVGKYDEAKETLGKYRQMKPGSETVDQLQLELREALQQDSITAQQ